MARWLWKGSGGGPGEVAAARGQRSDRLVDDLPRGQKNSDLRRQLATAHWGGPDDAAELLGEWTPGKFLLGRDHAGRYVGVRDDRHILTVAGSRAGKGTSLIVPNLLTWPGSVIATDPKGELATITACRRADESLSKWAVPMGGGGRVYVLDPFERVTGPATALRAAFNPVAGLDADSEEGLDRAGQIADALVIQQEGAAAHWTLSARAFLRGLILYIAKTGGEEGGNLLTIRDLLAQSEVNFNTMLQSMIRIGGTIGRAAHSLEAKSKDEKASVISTCNVQTDFLEGQSMRRVLSRSDFRMEDLKTHRMTVYLCLPANRLATHGRWFRLIVNLALEAMERTGPIKKDAHPVLFCLDEFATLGHMESIEKAAGQVAGFGAKLWPIVQDLTQLERDYNKAWQTFMGNAGLLTFFGNTDLFTLEHVSKRLGECEAIRAALNWSESWQDSKGTSAPSLFDTLAGLGSRSLNAGRNVGTARSMNENVSKTPLINPDEFARFFARDSMRLLALIAHSRFPPFVLRRCEYFSEEDDALFGGWFDPAEGMPDPKTTAAARANRSPAR